MCPAPPPRRYFLLCVNYFFYGETVTDYFFTLVQREEPLRILSKYHRFISFALYLTGTSSSELMTVVEL